MALRKSFPARDIMKQADADGFTITDVRHYSGGTRPDGRPAEYAEVSMHTPYHTKDGKFLDALGTVNLQSRHTVVSGYTGKADLQNMYPFADMMLSLHGSNVEDIAERAGKRRDGFEIFDKDENQVPYYEALDGCGRVMSAAVEFPHVFTFDEFQEVSIPMQDAAMKGLIEKYGSELGDRSAEARYDRYLDKVRLELSGGAVRYVGKVTSLVEFDRFREDYEMGRIYAEMESENRPDFDFAE